MSRAPGRVRFRDPDRRYVALAELLDAEVVTADAARPGDPHALEAARPIGMTAHS